jgi:hypothetical protein
MAVPTTWTTSTDYDYPPPQPSKIRAFFDDEPRGRNDMPAGFSDENDDVVRRGFYPLEKVVRKPAEILVPDFLFHL